ncbi:MAG: ATP-binding protein [Anaerolineae bacterium]
MDNLHGPSSLLYRWLLRLRYVPPVLFLLLSLVYEAIEHLSPWTVRLHLSTPLRTFLLEVLLFGVLGPATVWLILTWVARRVRERDEAEAHLYSLYQLSRQAMLATETEELVDIALRVPEQVVDPVGTAVIVQEHPDGPWMLAGTHGFRTEQREALETYLMPAGAWVRCSQCEIRDCTALRNCPLLSVLPEDLEPTVASVVCLPLSVERPPHAMLNIYFPEDGGLTPATRQVLESMTSELAVAIDRARLRARALHMTYHMDQIVRQQPGQSPGLQNILANIATALRAEAGVVFLASQENGESAPIPIAAWPGGEIHPDLTLPACQAFHEGGIVATSELRERGSVLAVPLVAEGLIMGTLALAGKPPFMRSEETLLSLAAGMIAVMMRNHQLYAELESQAILEERSRLAREVHDGLAQSLGSLNFKIQEIDRLLAREQWEAARQTLRESRETILDLYAEVRLRIQGLRWSLEEGQGLAECLDQCVATFANRTGLEVSLSVDGEVNISPQAEVQLLRVAQEALTNVYRHAQARRVWVRLSACPAGITLEVEDDGVGLPAEYGEGELPPEAAGHFGLHIIRERVEVLGGRMSLQRLPSQGTKLQVTVPPPDISFQPEEVNELDLYGSDGFWTAGAHALPQKW